MPSESDEYLSFWDQVGDALQQTRTMPDGQAVDLTSIIQQLGAYGGLTRVGVAPSNSPIVDAWWNQRNEADVFPGGIATLPATFVTDYRTPRDYPRRPRSLYDKSLFKLNQGTNTPQPFMLF